MSPSLYPAWTLLHIPHDSREIPAEVRQQFLLSDAELALEISRMTDHLTHQIFVDPLGSATAVCSEVSRLVVDVERFTDDALEHMSQRGMGAVYKTTSHLKPLRRDLTTEERDWLLRTWYHPHHRRLETAVTQVLERHGCCLVVDCHSFPDEALPYEKAEVGIDRADICIGSDPFHTPAELEQSFVDAFGRNGWRVAVNDPFAGALVPASRFQKDRRVHAIMVEVNRKLYWDDQKSEPKATFSQTASEVRLRCSEALRHYEPFLFA